MPNIRELSAPQGLGLRPSEVGVEATAAAGRRLGAFYNQKSDAIAGTGARFGSAIRDVGEVVENYETHREISHGAAAFAQLQDALTTKWNDVAKSADPNDPTVASKFREEVLEPALQEFAGGFNTERSGQWAQQHADSLRLHMFQKTSADMATLAGVAVKNNVQQAATSMSNTAFNDPSSVPYLLKSTDHTIGGIVSSSPNLKGVDAAKTSAAVAQDTKAAIVKAGFQGAIKTAADPEAEAKKWIERYPEYIDGSEANQFAKAAKAQAKANLLTEKQLQVYGRQQMERAAEAESSKIIADNFSTDDNGKLTIKPQALQQSIELARKYGDAGSGLARTMINFIEAQQNKELKPIDNPSVVRNLSDRLFDPENPLSPVDLMKARTSGQITDHTYSQLNGMMKELESTPLKGPIYQNTMKAVHDQLVIDNVPGVKGKDVVGATNYGLFLQAFVPQYLAKYRSGTLEPNALDIKDPNSFISKIRKNFERTPADRMRDYVQGIGGIAAQIPGEQSAPKADGQEVPAPLRGIAALQYNPTKKLWRDQTTGVIYNATGEKVSEGVK